MAFIKTSDREGCFRPEAVTHFTVYSTVEISSWRKTSVTFVKLFAGNSQIAQYHWAGDQALSYALIGKVLKRAEDSHDPVLSFDDLVEEEISTPSALS